MSLPVDHVQHEWALLAMRMPQLRTYPVVPANVAELCESYSVANLHLNKLTRSIADQAVIDDYRKICAEIEDEVRQSLLE